MLGQRRSIFTHLKLCVAVGGALGHYWARGTSWGWWDEWDDSALQTQHLKFEPWRSEAEHVTSRSQRLPTILNLYEWAEKKHFVSLKLGCQSGVRTRDLRLSKQAALTTATGPPPSLDEEYVCLWFVNVKHVKIKTCKYDTYNVIVSEERAIHIEHTM